MMKKINFIFTSKVMTISLFLLNVIIATSIILNKDFVNTNTVTASIPWEKFEFDIAFPDSSNKFLLSEVETTKSKNKFYTNKRGRSDFGSRMPASEEMATFITQGGVKKLVVKLNILCSSWNYLYGANINTKPTTANVQLCEGKALYLALYANQFFENNKLPIYLQLNESVKYDSNPIPKFSGPFSSEEQIYLVVSNDAPFDQAINNRDYSNQKIMPAITVEGIYELLNKTNGVSTSRVDKNVRIAIPIRGQSHIPSNIACKNADSLTSLTNFEANWGVTLAAWQSAPITNNFGVGRPCGTCPNPPPSYHRKISASTNPYGGPAVCEVDCVCAHETSWNDQYVWDSAFNGIRVKCGDYPGDVKALSGYNECGYKIISSTSPNIWTAKPDAFLLRMTDSTKGLSPAFYTIPERETLKWFSRFRRIYFPYTVNPTDIKKRPYEITLLLRPFSKDVVGLSAFVTDLSTNSRILSDGSPEYLDSPKRLFSVGEGGLMMNLNISMYEYVFVHEFGHMLGGWHQADSIPDANTGAWYNYSKQGIIARKLGAYKIPQTGQTTLMWNVAGDKSFNYISSRTEKSDKGYKLGRIEDNRLQMAKTINWLAGERLDRVYSVEEQAVIRLIPSLLHD